VLHSPAHKDALSEANRTALLSAIARAKGWVEEALEQPALDFAAIADRENLSERYIRLLAPLAFLSPRAIEAIIDGRGSPDLTVTALARSLPLSWAEQERRFGFV